MIGAEQGFLLLTSYLGDFESKPLTVAQFRTLAMRAKAIPRQTACRELCSADLVAIGYNQSEAQRIVQLLERKEQLEYYVNHGKKKGCYPIVRIQEVYPDILCRRLGLDSPGCLWGKGDFSLLQQPMVSLVGSRELRPENEAFAVEVGRQAALQGYVLVSGNARGADKIAQNSCLEQGGRVISIVADRLEDCSPKDRMLYLSEVGFEMPFSSQRALSRNRIIHCMGQMTFVAQCNFEKGGTWKGTVMNLRNEWSSVLCFNDHSRGIEALIQQGATGITVADLADISSLQTERNSFI